MIYKWERLKIFLSQTFSLKSRLLLLLLGSFERHHYLKVPILNQKKKKSKRKNEKSNFSFSRLDSDFIILSQFGKSRLHCSFRWNSLSPWPSKTSQEKKQRSLPLSLAYSCQEVHFTVCFDFPSLLYEIGVASIVEFKFEFR